MKKEVGQQKRGRKLTLGLERTLTAVAGLSFRRPVVALVLLSFVTAASLYVAKDLRIDADVAGLLPRSFPSVQALEKLKSRFGAVGSVAVVGIGAEPEGLRAFAEDIAPQLEALPLVDYVEYRRPVEFFEDRALYFLDLSDLETVAGRIEERVQWEKRRRNPMYVDLEESQAPDLDFADIEREYGHRSDRAWLERQKGHVYYMDEQAGLLILMAKPLPNNTDLAFARQVVAEVEELLSKQDMSKYGPDFHVELTGRFKKRVDQQEVISKDLMTASMLAAIFMILYLVFHFRRVGAVFLVMAPLLVGLSWMFGLATWQFGTLNILTGFISAILLGLGVDHGIHLLGRYEGERSVHGAEDAVRRTFGSTGRAAFIAALTSAVAFGGIAVSEFRAFREFGVIAGSGMVFVVLAFSVLMPAMLGIFERVGWRPRSGGSASVKSRSPYARHALRWAPVLAWTAAVGFFFLLVQAPDVRFDYDFGALEASNLPSFKLDRETNRLLGYSQTPMVVLTHDSAQEKDVADRIRSRMEALGSSSTLDMVATVADLIPTQQNEKQALLTRLKRTLRRIKPQWLEGDDREAFLKLKQMCSVEPFARKDLPLELRRQFENPRLSGEDGFVLVFPRISLSDGRKVRVMADEIRGVRMSDGTPLVIAGEGMILADILNMIWTEGPPVMAITSVLVLLLMWLLLGSFRDALLCLVVAGASIGGTLGLLAFAGIDLNYLNLIFLLVLLGIGVDASVHLVTGLSERADFRHVLEGTGRSVTGAILTTGLGFAALLIADHPGLTSVSHLALLGLSANLVATVVGLVGVMGLLTGIHTQRKGSASTATTLWVTCGYAGFAPVAPGTLGALIAFPAAWALGHLPPWVAALSALAIVLGGIRGADRYLVNNADKDPPEVVVDELAGCLIALLLVPMELPWLLAAFVAFRLLDILKPWPINAIARNWRGGLGVMADDVVAGLVGGGALAGLHAVGGMWGWW